jgi:hypothetical protein
MELYRSYDALLGIIPQHQGARKAVRTKITKVTWDDNWHEFGGDWAIWSMSRSNMIASTNKAVSQTWVQLS